MSQKMSVNTIFPTPIWTIDLSPDDTLIMNAQLMSAIEGLMTPRPVLPPGINWQTDPAIHRLPPFGDIVRLVEEAARSVADFLKLESRDLAVTGCWANVNPPGGRNQWHTHPNNFLAAVYYVATPDDEDRIAFEDPRPQATVMMPRTTEFSVYTGNTVTFKVRPGRLVLFPAWLKHSVPTNSSKRDRISIAFNLMFRNYVAESSPALFEGTVKIDPAAGN